MVSYWISRYCKEEVLHYAYGLLLKVLKEVHDMPWRASRKDKAGFTKVAQKVLGHIPLLGCMCGVLWGSQDKARLVKPDPKQQDFVKLQWSVA